jgi:hypothetical protein
MSDFNKLLSLINRRILFFVDEKFKIIIIKTIADFFPLLNNYDINVLNILVVFIIDLISFKYGFEKRKNIMNNGHKIIIEILKE